MTTLFTFENIIYFLGTTTFIILCFALCMLAIYTILYLFGWSFAKTTKFLSLQKDE